LVQRQWTAFQCQTGAQDMMTLGFISIAPIHQNEGLFALAQ
jgi:hypothetical protein